MRRFRACQTTSADICWVRQAGISVVISAGDEKKNAMDFRNRLGWSRHARSSLAGSYSDLYSLSESRCLEDPTGSVPARHSASRQPGGDEPGHFFQLERITKPEVHLQTAVPHPQGV